MFDKIKPLYDKILVKRVDEDTTTPGGIIIPDTSKEKAQVGEVIEVGAGRMLSDGKLAPLQVKKGDKVFFGKYSGTEADQDYLILKEDDVLGIIKK
jgi:chaperonin GroES